MTVALVPVSDKRIGHVRKYADRDGGAMRNKKFGHRRFGSTCFISWLSTSRQKLIQIADMLRSRRDDNLRAITDPGSFSS